MVWSLSDYGIAAVTVLGVVPSLIIVGILFAVGFALLVLWGLVSAVLWALGGVALLWLLSLTGLFNKDVIDRHPKVLLLVLIVPLFFIFGYMSERISSLSMFSLAQFVSENPNTTVHQLSLEGDLVNFIISNYALAALLIGMGMTIGLLSVMLIKMKRKYSWVR